MLTDGGKCDGEWKMEIRNGKVITLYKIEKILSILKDDIQVGESAFY